MGAFRWPRVFDPLDLEIIRPRLSAAWARVEANNFTRDTSKDDARKQALRQWIFALAGGHPVDFDTLADRLEKSIPKVLDRPPARASRFTPTSRRMIAARCRLGSFRLLGPPSDNFPGVSFLHTPVSGM